jgi:hypothetical protein
MQDDPLDSMRRIAAADQKTRFQDRVEANARSQIRARRIRWSLRIAILLLGAIGYACYHFSEGRGTMGTVAFFSFLAVLPASAVLFFMGGLAPARVRKVLSERQRGMLDD